MKHKSNLAKTRVGHKNRVKFVSGSDTDLAELRAQEALRLNPETAVALLDPKFERNKVQIEVVSRGAFKMQEGTVLISEDRSITFVDIDTLDRTKLGTLSMNVQEDGDVQISVIGAPTGLRGLPGSVLAEFRQRLNDASFDYALKSAVLDRHTVPYGAIIPPREEQSAVRRLQAEREHNKKL